MHPPDVKATSTNRSWQEKEDAKQKRPKANKQKLNVRI